MGEGAVAARFVAVRLAYVAVILVATLTNLRFSGDLGAASARLARAVNPAVAWHDAIDALRNVALFAGLGAVWVVTSLTGRVRGEILRATLTGVGLSAFVEGLQLFSPVREASLLDVTTNTIGAFSGALGIAAVIAAVHAARGRRSYLGIPMFLFAGAYLAAVLGEALTPLFHSEMVGRLGGGGPLFRVRAALHYATPLDFGEIVFSDVPLYAAAGFLAVTLLVEGGTVHRRAAWLTALTGGAIVAAAHVTHGAFSLPIRYEAIATDVAALALGAWCAFRWLTPLSQALRGASRAGAVIFAYGTLLALWGWRPFLLETRAAVIMEQFRRDAFIPLRSLSGRLDVFSAVHVAQQFLLYLPLGALLAIRPLRTTGRWAHLLPAVWLSLAIESGHALVEGRTLDITNAVIACAGLAIGWIVVRRSGFAPRAD